MNDRFTLSFFYYTRCSNKFGSEYNKKFNEQARYIARREYSLNMWGCGNNDIFIFRGIPASPMAVNSRHPLVKIYILLLFCHKYFLNNFINTIFARS
jgi:hypothetical protein